MNALIFFHVYQEKGRGDRGLGGGFAYKYLPQNQNILIVAFSREFLLDIECNMLILIFIFWEKHQAGLRCLCFLFEPHIGLEIIMQIIYVLNEEIKCNRYAIYI